MSMDIEVRKDVLIPSPARHIECWAVNPCYTSRDGLGMVMTGALHTAYLGCHGNRTIRTPNVDQFCQTWLG